MGENSSFDWDSALADYERFVHPGEVFLDTETGTYCYECLMGAIQDGLLYEVESAGLAVRDMPRDVLQEWCDRFVRCVVVYIPGHQRESWWSVDSDGLAGAVDEWIEERVVSIDY